MKKSKELILFQTEIQNNIKNIDLLIGQYLKKIKKEFAQIIIEEKNKLLLKIAEGENIDINALKSKYLKSKELTYDDKSDENTTEEVEQLLEKIVIDGKTFYYENKEKGKVFDDKTNEIGVYKNSSFTFY